MTERSLGQFLRLAETLKPKLQNPKPLTLKKRLLGSRLRILCVLNFRSLCVGFLEFRFLYLALYSGHWCQEAYWGCYEGIISGFITDLQVLHGSDVAFWTD